MENKSLWVVDIKEDIINPLNKNIEVDVLIIGGGLTGITTAFYLKDSDLDVALIEKDKVGYGVSSRTTGKLTYLQELIYHKLEKNFDFETSKLYLEFQKEAIRLVKENIEKYNINCNFMENSSYVFTDNDSKINEFKLEEDFFKRANIKCSNFKKLPLKYPCKYVIKGNDTAVFHPVKYILALRDICIKEKISIYDNTSAMEIIKEENNYICQTNNNTIKAKKIIVACHYPFFIIPGFIPFKTRIEKSYLSASYISDIKRFNAITNGKPTKSIRYHEDKGKKYLLFVGQSHNLCNCLNREERYKELINELKEMKIEKIKYYWTNHDIITNDSLPLIGLLQKNNPNLLIGTGYNTWGMTNGTIAGKLLSDIVLNNENKYIELFKPYRGISLDKVKNNFINTYSNVKGFVLTKVIGNYSWYKNIAKIETRNGKKVGVYIDENHKEHIVLNICPHLKCSLIFNKVDKTWDCPCHGSRFDINGKSVQGPSVYNISIDE